MSIKNDLAYYGSVGIQRVTCPECGRSAFVIDNETACCGVEFKLVPKRAKQFSQPPKQRRRPGKADQARILTEQQGCCFYCKNPFGHVVLYKHRLVELKVRWDHILPWSYGMNNRAENFVASCQVCNGYKGNLVFASTEDARGYILRKAAKKGVDWDPIREGWSDTLECP